MILPKRQTSRWPTKNQIKKLVWKKPLIHAAKEIGISDVALRKRCIAMNIELPGRGYWGRSAENRSVPRRGQLAIRRALSHSPDRLLERNFVE